MTKADWKKVGISVVGVVAGAFALKYLKQWKVL